MYILDNKDSQNESATYSKGIDHVHHVTGVLKTKKVMGEYPYPIRRFGQKNENTFINHVRFGRETLSLNKNRKISANEQALR